MLGIAVNANTFRSKKGLKFGDDQEFCAGNQSSCLPVQNSCKDHYYSGSKSLRDLKGGHTISYPRRPDVLITLSLDCLHKSNNLLLRTVIINF